MNNYQEYLQSDHWKKLTEETKRLAGYRCQVCGSEGILHTHHNTYERIGDEFQSDLIALCASCHKLFHGKKKKVLVYLKNGGQVFCDSLSDLQLLLVGITEPSNPLYIYPAHVVLDEMWTIEFDRPETLHRWLVQNYTLIGHTHEDNK